MRLVVIDVLCYDDVVVVATCMVMRMVASVSNTKTNVRSKDSA
jgi:hypothetical protein